jgi:hypothetical protein
MSITKDLHTESSESHAAQQMNSTMGIDPALSQLNDRGLENELTSKRAGASTADAEITDTETTNETTEPTGDEIEEARRASWGQPTKDDEAAGTRIADADWNRSTEEGGMTPAETDEPDRTYGHS